MVGIGDAFILTTKIVIIYSPKALEISRTLLAIGSSHPLPVKYLRGVRIIIRKVGINSHYDSFL